LQDLVKHKRQTAQQAEAQQQRQGAFDNYLQQLGMHATRRRGRPPHAVQGHSGGGTTSMGNESGF